MIEKYPKIDKSYLTDEIIYLIEKFSTEINKILDRLRQFLVFQINSLHFCSTSSLAK